MGYVITFSGQIPASAVKDRDVVGGILNRMSKQSFTDQSPSNRYPEIADWMDESGSLSIDGETKDWGTWVELTLQAVAPHISGRHEVEVDGEDGEHWILILDGGKLYEQMTARRATGEPKLWSP